ncbi:glycosyltransferase EpsD [Paenibacillus endophyticus]|uniref:Glycosyltransferase EpsD n=1 Tax=Paenibacillus endophyticus TaxID=1294268 RepID=A0A7W5C2T1_9BACL|nr:glycosyltransferase family 4 protein [Paenibacillus endophyticus]MBB3150036.1 glycosyltransferase EpsD [Paenibacillus endophyticus]
MPNKILFCATVDYHFKAFHLPVMEWFKQQGWEVHIAAKGDMELPFADRKFNLPIERSPIHMNNSAAYRELKAIINEQQYKIIHCHTPTGGVLARLAAQEARKKGTKVIYTAHGFHFCKGGSLLNWILYYPIEKYFARLTDYLITINNEDYQLAVSRRFKAKQIAHVHGVGVNTSNYKPMSKIDKWRLRQELDYRTDDFLMFYAAEFNKNKNHQLLIQAMAAIKEEVPHARLLLAGKGALLEESKQLAEQLGVGAMVHFLGYRTDIDKLLPMCDVAVASSLREGLPVNIMEAMACGLPIVATRNRGHSELVMDGENGYLVKENQIKVFANKLVELSRSKSLREELGEKSGVMVKKYSLAQVALELNDIYKSLMEQPQADNKERLQWVVL